MYPHDASVASAPISKRQFFRKDDGPSVIKSDEAKWAPSSLVPSGVDGSASLAFYFLLSSSLSLFPFRLALLLAAALALPMSPSSYLSLSLPFSPVSRIR